MKFEVNDVVRVYRLNDATLNEQILRGEILEVCTNGTLKILCTKERLAILAHPKQCRRLKKKERRRVWIYENTLKDIEDGRRGSFLAQNISLTPFDNCIEFIEVKRTDREGE